ncbi:MAG TPA: N(4)-(beta-N-acetylglucosaminyl)-L-asparaginase [Candidatus Polarisedimenticolaceae bacterium]|nr:N(4)-(beta-N-acetylglucosaminyl)-L-asparaginase [Candidatus Polarisedimenticolaceae bacterium]
MPEEISRRSFVKTGLAFGAAALSRGAPAAIDAKPARPVVIASRNGHEYTNGGPRTAVQEAHQRIVRGEDVLDAILGGVTILELDPAEDSVGYGGLPNADGVVQLDASVMHGPKKRAGAVAALEGVRTPSLVAKLVMETTDHHLLVGEGAREFARRMGVRIEDDLNTENSRKLWLEWKRRIDPKHYLDPQKRVTEGARARAAMLAEGLLARDRVWGTIHMSAVSARGEICAATTTSGLSFKIPGRVGDSPILGAGDYVDGDVGAAGSTGRGEANLYGCSAFLIVEEMRRGTHPKDAVAEALRRIRARTIERRLRRSDGTPNFDIKFYALNVRGEHAGMAMHGGAEPKYAVCDESGPRLVAMDALLPGKPED